MKTDLFLSSVSCFTRSYATSGSTDTAGQSFLRSHLRSLLLLLLLVLSLSKK